MVWKSKGKLKMSKLMIRLSVKLKLATIEELDKMAKDWNVSLSALMRHMIEHYLKVGVKGKKGARNVKTG